VTRTLDDHAAVLLAQGAGVLEIALLEYTAALLAKIEVAETLPMFVESPRILFDA
jgi:hypothetical protein